MAQGFSDRLKASMVTSAEAGHMTVVTCRPPPFFTRCPAVRPFEISNTHARYELRSNSSQSQDSMTIPVTEQQRISHRVKSGADGVHKRLRLRRSR
jgi:hypothetical protein